MDDPQLFVARFLEHPLGAGRYVKDFRRNLTYSNKVWWDQADETARKKHFEWSLNHKQYHYSTDDINKADLWQEQDEEDRVILEKYAKVYFTEVTLGLVDQETGA